MFISCCSQGVFPPAKASSNLALAAADSRSSWSISCLSVDHETWVENHPFITWAMNE